MAATQWRKPVQMAASRISLRGLVTSANRPLGVIVLPRTMELFSSHKATKVVRLFSTTPPPGKGKESEEEGGLVRRAMNMIFTPANQFYALVGGGTIGAYVISRGFISFTSFFTHLNPAVVAKWGFYTGFGCASMVGGLAVATASALTIRADPVYQYCFNWVANDTTVQSAIGDGIKAGHLRSYRLDAGNFGVEGSTPVWKPPRIQMIFDVEAMGPPYRTGVVTCEAIKKAGFPPSLETTLLKLDYETGDEGDGGTKEDDQTIFLKGDQAALSRVSSRSGLSLDMLGRSLHINKAASGRY